MNKTESIPFPADAEALAAAIAEKKDVISVLTMISDHLKAHAAAADREQQAGQILIAMRRAIAAPVLAARKQADAGGPRCLILEGSDADWLWAGSQFAFAVGLSRDSVFEPLSIRSEELSRDLIRRTPCRPDKVMPILEALEDSCSYLSRVIAGGLHVVSLPSVTLPGAEYEVHSKQLDGGVCCVLQLMPDEREVEYLTLYSAFASLVKVLPRAQFSRDAAIDLIRRSYLPNADVISADDFVRYFYRGMMTGLSILASVPYLTASIACSEEMRSAWSSYAADLIRGLKR